MTLAELRIFFTPLAERPALAAFFCSALFLSVAEFPLYGTVLLPLLIASLALFPKFPRRAALGVLVFFSLRLATNAFWLPDKETFAAGGFSARGCGRVESVLDRPEGVAAIVRDNGRKFRLSKKQAPYPEPGDSISYTAKWFPAEPPTVPGGFDSPKWLRTQGLSAFGKMESYNVIRKMWVPEKSFSAFRKWLKSYFARYMPPAETGLLIGLLAGDRSGIPDALQSGFRRTGIVHVLAISGFHIVLLSGMILLLLKATRMPHRIARILAIVLMLAYAPVTGGSPAVNRAVFMFTVVQLGFLFERKADGLNSLGVALLILAAIDPQVIWNVGFELSAAATAGILAYGKRNPFTVKNEFLQKNRLWKFFESNVLSALWITLVATASTAPFLIWSFHSLSPVSICGNILVVPLVGLGMQAGLFALLLPIPPIAATFAASAGILFRLSAYLVGKFSAVPVASVTAGPFPVWVLLVFGVIVLSIGAFRKNPWARFFVIGSCLSFGCYFVYNSFIHKADPAWKVVVLDIGQGDCIFVKSPAGNAYLVDAGVNTGKRNVASDKIIPFLQNEGVWKLEGIFITHPDLDHFSGAEVLLREFPVSHLWIQECARIAEKPEWQRAIATAYGRRIIVQDLKRGMVLRERFRQSPRKTIEWEMRILHPDPSLCGEANSESLTMRVAGIGGSLLLTGDLTKAGEREILSTDIPLKTDILKLGHHGSKTSSSREFLEKVKPEIAIASSGRKNRFHHPSKATVERLDSLKIPLLNTAKVGSVVIDFDEKGYRISTALESEFNL